jgi:hypothetical protein
MSVEQNQPIPWESAVRRFLTERNAFLLFLFFCIYALAAISTARAKPLWYDEIFTVYLARFETPRQLWDNLADGVDLNPPMIYLTTRLTVAVLGETHLGIRFPSILAFGLFLWGMHRLVARWLGLLQAWLVLVVLAASSIGEFAVEARPYALMMMFAVAALLCWRNTLDERRAWLWRVGLGLALVAAVSSHYYTVLVFPALAGVELARTYRTRRCQPWNWAALVLPGLVLGVYAPLMARAKTYSAGFWARADWLQSEPGYAFYLGNLAVPLVVTLLVLAVLPRRQPAAPVVDGAPDPATADTPDHWSVVCAGVAFTLIPLLAVGLGVVVTGVFSFRYALPGVIGLSLLFVVLVNRQAEGRTLPLVVLVLAFACWASVTWGARQEYFAQRAAAQGELHGFLEQHCGGREVVVASSHTYLATAYYSEDATFRPVYLADATLPTRYGYFTTDELGLIALRRPVPLGVVDLDAYLRQNSEVLFYGTSWLNQNLPQRGYVFEEIATHGKEKLYRVRKA